jgi:NAD(P)-dependent dehydrogenase (short-subunit alcohol dehydrogenase family)
MSENRDRLSGKTVLVTGSTKGFGAAMARRFAVEGASVILTGRNEAHGRRIEREIVAAGGTSKFIRADLIDESSVRDLVEAAVQQWGGLDGLVNNAAAMDEVGSSERPIAEMETDGFDRIIRVGIHGLFWACKYAIPKLIEAGGGSIVNVSSLAAVAGIPSLPAYSMCKGAMGALTRQLATDYGHYGIRVNTMICGLVLDPALAATVAADPVAGPKIAEAQLTRYGRLDDVAAMAGYLVSDDSAFVTGSELRIDGGWSAAARFPRLAELVHGSDTAAA